MDTVFYSSQSLSTGFNIPVRNWLLHVALQFAWEEWSTELRSVFWELLAFIQDFIPISSAVILAVPCMTLEWTGKLCILLKEIL